MHGIVEEDIAQRVIGYQVLLIFRPIRSVFGILVYLEIL